MLKRLQAYLRIIRIFVAVFQDICGCQRFRRRLPCGKIFFRNGQQNLIRKERISGTYAPLSSSLSIIRSREPSRSRSVRMGELASAR